MTATILASDTPAPPPPPHVIGPEWNTFQKLPRSKSTQRRKLLHPKTVRKLVSQNIPGKKNMDYLDCTRSFQRDSVVAATSDSGVARLLSLDVEELMCHTSRVRRQRRRVESVNQVINGVCNDPLRHSCEHDISKSVKGVQYFHDSAFYGSIKPPTYVLIIRCISIFRNVIYCYMEMIQCMNCVFPLLPFVSHHHTTLH